MRHTLMIGGSRKIILDSNEFGHLAGAVNGDLFGNHTQLPAGTTVMTLITILLLACRFRVMGITRTTAF